MFQRRIGFIGAGQMATALAQGLLNADLTASEKLIASDPTIEARDRFAQLTGARTTEDNAEVAAEVEVLFLSVKPQRLAEVMSGLRGKIPGDTLVVSIAAGTRLKTIAEGLGPQTRLVRVMPNTPCLVGQGASGYCLGQNATAEDGKLVGRLLSAAGVAVEVEERLLDAVTGLSGSGPAFVYMMIEALSDGGVRMGLPRTVATKLAAQTLRGAAEMVLTTGEHPGVLKDRVTSPSGTTIAGVRALEAAGLRSALMAAVEAATLRSAELGAG